VQVIERGDERVDMPGTAIHRFTELFLDPTAINVIAHDVLTPVTAGHDMILASGYWRGNRRGIHSIATYPGSDHKTQLNDLTIPR
jgi:hypothetical protein